MENLTAKTVREIAVESPLTTRVFEDLKIDYCCGGKTMFLDACQKAGVSPELAIERIERVMSAGTRESGAWPEHLGTEDLLDHILDTHHVFTRDEISRLTPLLEKVVEKHGRSENSLLDLKRLVRDLFADLTIHMQKEEMMLFPYIRELASAGDMAVDAPPFGSVRNPVSMMMMEHDRAGEILSEMRTVTDGYRLPKGACPSFTALYERLEAFEKDLHQHIHLENNVLFPKAVGIEEEI